MKSLIFVPGGKQKCVHVDLLTLTFHRTSNIKCMNHFKNLKILIHKELLLFFQTCDIFAVFKKSFGQLTKNDTERIRYTDNYVKYT